MKPLLRHIGQTAKRVSEANPLPCTQIGCMLIRADMQGCSLRALHRWYFMSHWVRHGGGSAVVPRISS
jgi:hypothetical protein